MKVRAEFTFICGKKGKKKDTGKEWYQASIKVTDPDEVWDVFTDKETFEKLSSMFVYEGIFEAKKWGDKVHIGSLLGLAEN